MIGPASTRRWVVGLGLSGLLGCREADPTTFSLGLRIGPAEPAEGAVVQVADLTVNAVRLRSCDTIVAGTDTGFPYVRGFRAGERPRRLVPVEVHDPVRPGGTLLASDSRDQGFDLPVPTGAWCEMQLVLDSTLYVAGVVPSTDATFSLELQLPHVAFLPEGGFGGVSTQTIDGQAGLVAHDFTVELGFVNWLDPVAIPLAAGVDVAVAPGDADHDAIVTRLIDGVTGEDGSRLVRTSNADRDLTDEERELGAVARAVRVP